MKIINIALSLAVSGMGVTLAAPSGPIFGRQSLSLPTGQGALHLLNPSGTAVGCLNYFGMVVADPNSASCYQYFNADEYSDDKSASFADNRGPCTFYPFSDGSYNYTCSSESFAPKNQFQYSTFQVSNFDSSSIMHEVSEMKG